MLKVRLVRDYVYRGEIYLKGEHNLEDDVANVLLTKQRAIKASTLQAAQPPSAPIVKPNEVSRPVESEVAVAPTPTKPEPPADDASDEPPPPKAAKPKLVELRRQAKELGISEYRTMSYSELEEEIAKASSNG